MTPAKRMEQRLQRLQEHLKRENPVLVDAVNQYRDLDAIACKLGLLQSGESYATQISWWPMVSVLGTFSAGKSSFINSYLDVDLQRTGNQAVDDRFTVITFSPDDQVRTLPGLALDGDPRFPFYQISEEIEQVSAGEGAKIDNYLQMKVAPSEKLRGKIIIDSPGFDADEQRKSTLRITDHIIELSDLVLVFFDARHPEPGAMQDTLEHLVKGSMRRNDSSKFLFILNQIDTSAREDNLEDIVSSWQKALVQQGLSAGSFHILFNEDLAVPVENENVWSRYVDKREADYSRIMARIDSINIERVYRIVGSIETQANQIEKQAVPAICDAIARWKKQVLIADAVVFAVLAIAWISLKIQFGFGEDSTVWTLISIAIPLLIAGTVHFLMREKLALRIAGQLSEEAPYGNLSAAFIKSTKFWRSIFLSSPAGWGGRARRRLDSIRDATDQFVQQLNDRFTSPSGDKSGTTESPSN